jgi:hypothetical protein
MIRDERTLLAFKVVGRLRVPRRPGLDRLEFVEVGLYR